MNREERRKMAKENRKMDKKNYKEKLVKVDPSEFLRWDYTYRLIAQEVVRLVSGLYYYCQSTDSADEIVENLRKINLEKVFGIVINTISMIEDNNDLEKMEEFMDIPLEETLKLKEEAIKLRDELCPSLISNLELLLPKLPTELRDSLGSSSYKNIAFVYELIARLIATLNCYIDTVAV